MFFQIFLCKQLCMSIQCWQIYKNSVKQIKLLILMFKFKVRILVENTNHPPPQSKTLSKDTRYIKHHNSTLKNLKLFEFSAKYCYQLQHFIHLVTLTLSLYTIYYRHQEARTISSTKHSRAFFQPCFFKYLNK